MFETGHDFFSELKSIGVVHPLRIWPPDARDWEGFHAATEAAWHRLGALYLANRDPNASNRDQPWALDEFGAPNADH